LQRAFRLIAQRQRETLRQIERILAQEDDHANDMHGVLVAHEETPMLPQ
jgi:hypothetical protein